MAIDGWPGPCDVALPLGELMSVVASPMFVDVMPVGVLLPLVSLPPAVVPPPTALAPPDVETPNVNVVGKLVATALDGDELLDPLLLVTSSPLFRLAIARALEFDRLMVLLGVPLEPD